MVFMAKRKSTKINKNPQKNKLLPRVNEVVSVYIDSNCNISKTAKQFKVDRLTVHRFLETPEAKAEIKRRNEETAILSENMTRSVMTECFNQFMRAKKKMTQKDFFYALANLIGKTSDIQVAKIQAGVGQGSTESNNRQLTTDQLEHIKSVTKE